MGRPQPSVLFAQTFVHPQLDEYVDEVLFSEPVVISACEFVEQNSASACAGVKLMGATSPPSFALEVFVQCEGETRFRRLCQPFLYSHSSSNVLEVEAIVTNHLVVRGSYRSLSLVIYGNTAEDLGQFNIEVDLDSSLTDTVSAIEGDLEDLPPALHPTNLTIEESVSALKTLSLKAVPLDIPLEVKQFLKLTFKILESPNLGVAVNMILNSLLSVASVYSMPSLNCRMTLQDTRRTDRFSLDEKAQQVLTEAIKELLNIYKSLNNQSGNASAEFSSENLLDECEADLASSKQLADTLSQFFKNDASGGNIVHPDLSQMMNAMLLSAVALLLCSSRESCFHFVNAGSMEHLRYAFSHGMQTSTTLKLMLLGVIEQATRHSIGCEGFLGWWPREDENIPSSVSEGYNQLLKLLLQKPRHDVASLATFILHRLRFYEVASRYEFAVLSVLGGLSSGGPVTTFTLDMLGSAKLQLRKLWKLINLRGPIEDPSLMAHASRSLILGDAGRLSYKSTSGLINLSKCCFSNWDIDSHLLSLLKERGFLPLSAALLSSAVLRFETGHAMDLFVDIVSYIEAIILSLLFCRSGLIFLANDPEVATTVIRALRGVHDWEKEESASLRYASVLISKGFFCHPHEVGRIIEMHLKAINAADRLITLTPSTEEFLWALWELCGLSRSNCGRQTLLALVHFPEVISVLMSTLHSVKELDPVSTSSGASPLNLAIFHAAAEIFEIIVTDSAASSLGSWIEHAKELHRVLNLSSPGSNKKDAPARLLEWIDASIVYQRNGTIGLLRYTAVLASGGDAHVASTSILPSDSVEVDTVVDSSNGSDGNIIDNLLGKRITEKDFPGVVLRDSSIVQLTTAFRILAFISDNSVVAGALYDEGAVMVVHAVLINCRLMLERSSNIYDYLVDEGSECNSTSDLLLERNREQSLVDLLIPSLVLLLNLLQKLENAKEQHRNTKLMSALLALHREVSPKLAACAADLSYPHANFALGLEAVCHLLASALASWPVYGWTPGLFHFFLDSLHATSLLSLGPKETCSLLCLLNDLFPDEGVWYWENGTPILSILRGLAVGTFLGLQKEKQITWYLQSGRPEKLLSQLAPHLGKLSEITLHCAISTLVVIQDMLRIFIIRIAHLNMDTASELLHPMILWISEHLDERSALSDTDAYKVHRLLTFLAILLEHPYGTPLVLKEGGVQMFMKVLQKCVGAIILDVRHSQEMQKASKSGFSTSNWCIPVLKSVSLLVKSRTSLQSSGKNERHVPQKLSEEECCVFLSYVLTLCKNFPVGKELVACLSAFRELSVSTEGQIGLVSIFLDMESSTEGCESGSWRKSYETNGIINAFEWKEHPPLLYCWMNLSRSIRVKYAPPVDIVEAIGALSLGALCFCIDGQSVNLERVAAIKILFGFTKEGDATDSLFQKSMESIQEYFDLLASEASTDSDLAITDVKTSLHQVMESAKSLMLLLQTPSDIVKADDIISSVVSSVSSSVPLRMHKIADGSSGRTSDSDLGDIGEQFLWECPENLRDRLAQTGLPGKRKISALDGPNRRARIDGPSVESVAPNTFSRGSVPPAASGPTRRDTFRQRKPNTSRPPSMHVDDYVARERNADGTNNPNVIAVPRVGPTSGRPPSIHVDEFMARQRERQNHVVMAISDSGPKEKIGLVENSADTEKMSKSRPLKPDLDDDLQEIDIVFDAEEAEPDDKLPFPQPDDNLQQPSSLVVEQSSPHSIVEETESDANENSQFSHLGTPVTSNLDESTRSEFSSRMSVSRSDMQLNRESSTSSDKKFGEQSEDSRGFPVKVSSGFDSAPFASSSGYSAPVNMKIPMSALQLPMDSRGGPNLYSKTGLHHSGTVPSVSSQVQGCYDQKFQSNQPPLPPMPPPQNSGPIFSQTADNLNQSTLFVSSMADVQPPVPPGFNVQSGYTPSLSSISASLMTSSPMADSKYARTSSAGSARLPPPLPPTPPPFSVNLSLSSLKNSTTQSAAYSQNVTGVSELQQNSIASLNDTRLSDLSVSGTILTSYPPPPLVPPLFFVRPGSVPGLYSGSATPHHAEHIPNISQNVPVSLPSIHSVPSLAQLQPLQPPQIPRPPPQHVRPLLPVSPQSEQGLSSLQSSLQMPMQPLQMLQQTQTSSSHVYYQIQQEKISSSLLQQQTEHPQEQAPPQQGDGMLQQQDSGMSLHQYFRSPEAIQSLLSDRDKLCQLLEQHPKLMQMLQERLGQL